MELERLINTVPIPVKESVGDSAAKVNVLLQSYISRLRLDGFALLSDVVYVKQSGARIMRALLEIALENSWASLSRSLLQMCIMVERRI